MLQNVKAKVVTDDRGGGGRVDVRRSHSHLRKSALYYNKTKYDSISEVL